MHSYRVLVDATELERVLGPVLSSNGSEIPAPGCYIAAVEFDEAGDVVAYQMMQNAVFLEGLWARDHSAHLLTLYRLISRHAKEVLKVNGMMTLTRNDAAGKRIGRLAEKLGFERMNWTIFRRTKCQ